MGARHRSPGRRRETRSSTYAVDEGLAAIFDVVGATNRYLDGTAPWHLVRKLSEGGGDTATAGRLSTVLYHTLEAIRVVALALAPFLPATSATLCDQLGQTPPTAGDWGRLLTWGAGSWHR